MFLFVFESYAADNLEILGATACAEPHVAKL